ncbi:NUDIX domain-containing protein [Algicella marina]|uniref:NUDIX domain-containing protein n=1 Tax=Algicella marina TaxID=2683284 RepID=A0A6P1T6R3_9RHOB|nr:NUDIX hydrolase [Algicella marina]QHQ37176.1 NUDIX domain-containing protein [Algicella marina]
MRDKFRAIGDVSDAGKAEAVGVILEDASGRLLLQLRDLRDEVIFGGYWSFFGGGVEGGETLIEAAQRETEEEIGVALAATELAPFGWTRSLSVRRTRIYVFTATRTVEPVDVTLDEGAGFAFWDERQLPKVPIVPFLQPVLQEYLELRRKRRTLP